MLNFEPTNQRIRININKVGSKKLLAIAVLGASYVLGSTFAANINLNSNQTLQFGQGVAQTIACDSQVIVTPQSAFINVAGHGEFKFSSIDISDIDMDSCNGKTIQIDAYNQGSGRLSNIADESDTPIQIAISNGVFKLLNDLDARIQFTQSGPPFVGNVKITFNNPRIASNLVNSITLQSMKKDILLNDFLIHYDFANLGSYSGTGTQVFDLNGNVLAGMSSSGMFRSDFGGFLAIDGPSNFFGTLTDASPLFLQRENGDAQSVALWIRPKRDGIIFDEQAHPEFDSQGWHDSQIELFQGKFRFRVWGMNFDVSTPTEIEYPSVQHPEGIWYHIAFTHDGNYFRVYINGLETYTTSPRSTPWENYSPTYFGLGTNDSTHMYVGNGAAFDLASLRIYSRALSSGEMNTLYTSSQSRFN